ncbi:hypothetical protein B0J14DRAFT_579277 [Halenospora varia]|nr:hypothetical protein B0J14DRAFT_579277 [Halenospora varia]
MASSVGPMEELARYNFNVIADRLGVGQNMWDHVLFPATHEINIDITFILEDPVQANIASQLYNRNQTGISTTDNAHYLDWEKILAKYYDNLIMQAKADLATFPAN